jgi:hypothetical protein
MLWDTAKGTGCSQSMEATRLVVWLQGRTLAWMLVECGVSLYGAATAHRPALAFGVEGSSAIEERRTAMPKVNLVGTPKACIMRVRRCGRFRRERLRGVPPFCRLHKALADQPGDVQHLLVQAIGRSRTASRSRAFGRVRSRSLGSVVMILKLWSQSSILFPGLGIR